MYRIVESLFCTPETNITLYVDYIGIKIKNLIKIFKKEIYAFNKKANKWKFYY